jgi:hypothetical protein
MPERIVPNGYHQMRHQVKHHISGLRVHGEEKQRRLHQRIDKIKSICNENDYMVNPQFRLSDFEAALQDSIRIVFDNVQVKGCWFHYVQCLYRYVKRLGYQKQHEQDRDFRCWFKQFTALAMIPLDRP